MKYFDRIIIGLLVISGIFILNYLGEAGFDQIRSRITVSQPLTDEFELNTENIPNFWNIDDIKSKELNITIVDSSISNSLNITRITFNSGHYNNTPIRVYAEIKNQLDSNDSKPVMIFIHGFGGNHSQTDPFTDYYVNKGYITLAIDLPGFSGASEGFPMIKPENIEMSILNPMNSSLYTLETAVINTISVVSSVSQANNSEIILVGASLGGILTMYTAALDNRVTAGAVYLASGDFANGIEYGGFLNAFFPHDKYPNPLESQEIRNYLQLFDPLIYAHHINIPILYSIGTDDEFFSIKAANTTFASIPGQKTLNFIPEQSHDLSIDLIADSVDTWLSTRTNTSIILPQFEISQQKLSNIFFDENQILISVNTSIPIKYIKFHYREDYVGTKWKTINLTNIHSIENISLAFYALESPIISVPVSWFISVELIDNSTFTSILFENSLSNAFFSPLMALLGLLLAFPLVVQVYTKYRRLNSLGFDIYTKNYLAILLSEFIVIITIQGLFIYSISSLPWFLIKYQENYSLTWTLPNLLNFVIKEDFVGYSVIILLYLGLVISLASPRVGWIFGFLISSSILIFTFSYLSDAFGYTYGFFLSLILPILQLFVAIAFNRFIKKVVWKEVS